MIYIHRPYAVEAAFAELSPDQWSAGPGSLEFWGGLRPGATWPPERKVKTGCRAGGGSPRDLSAAHKVQQRRAEAQAMAYGAQIYALYEQGKTFVQIGAIIGKDKSTVGAWLRRYCAARGLPVPARGRGDQQRQAIAARWAREDRGAQTRARMREVITQELR